MKRIIYLAIILVLIFSCYTYYSMQDSIDNFFETTKTIVLPSQKTWVEPPVISNIRSMKKLISTSYYEEIAQVERKEGWFSNNEIVIIYKVTLKFGYDLEYIHDEDIIKSDSSIIITLPNPEILEKHCNPSDKIVFHESDSWTEQEISKFHENAINKVIDNAKESGIYELTKERGVEYFKQLFISLGYSSENISVKFRE